MEPMAENINLAEWYKSEVLPRLTPEMVFQGTTWTSRKGKDWRAACPLHGGNEKTAFSMNPETLRWTCYTGTCGSGDALDFLADGQGFVEGVRAAAALVGLDLPEREMTPEAKERMEAAHRRHNLLEDFLDLCKSTLSSEQGKAARAHLTEGRGFPVDSLEGLPLGLCPDKETVQSHLEKAGHGAKEIEGVGLLYMGGRLMIGLRNRWGNLADFAGRDLTGKSDSKYLYLRKGTTKRPAIFGLDHALAAAKKAPEGLVLVEGVLDMLALHGRGLANVGAIGKAILSAAGWESLAAAGVNKATLALDADNAGDAGTRTSIHNVTNVTNAPIISIVSPRALWEAAGSPKEKGKPSKVDPDSLVQEKGLEAFRGLLNERQTAGLFLGLEPLEGITPDSPQADRRQAVEEIMDLAARLRGHFTKLDQEDLLEEAGKRTGYSLEALADLRKEAVEAREKEDNARAMAAAVEDARRGLADKKDPIGIASTLAGKLARVSVSGEEPPAVFSVDRLLEETKALPDGLKSGWNNLDRLDVSFNPGELALLAARTGHGKTSALVGLVSNWLQPEASKGRLVIYSHEEPEVSFFHRLLAAETARLVHLKNKQETWAATAENNSWGTRGVRGNLRGLSGVSGEGNGDTLREALDNARTWEDRLLIVHNPGWTAEQIGNHARSLAGPIGGVFVDYLQRIPVDEKADRRDIQISLVGRTLKAMAGDLSCPVVAGAQINREAIPAKYAESLQAMNSWEEAKELIKKARPELHHLREGGSEQEADLVLGLLNYRADYVMDDSPGRDIPGYATTFEVGVLKNRFGETGAWTSLAFVAKSQWLRDPGERETL